MSSKLDSTSCSGGSPPRTLPVQPPADGSLSVEFHFHGITNPPTRYKFNISPGSTDAPPDYFSIARPSAPPPSPNAWVQSSERLSEEATSAAGDGGTMTDLAADVDNEEIDFCVEVLTDKEEGQGNWNNFTPPQLAPNNAEFVPSCPRLRKNSVDSDTGSEEDRSEVNDDTGSEEDRTEVNNDDTGSEEDRTEVNDDTRNRARIRKRKFIKGLSITAWVAAPPLMFAINILRESCDEDDDDDRFDDPLRPWNYRIHYIRPHRR